MSGTEHDLPVADATRDTNSDATLDEVQVPPWRFGAPLTRMVRLEYLSSSSAQSSDADDLEDPEDSEYFVRDEQINHIEEDMSLFDLALARRDGDAADGDPSLRSTSHAYVNHVVNDMVPLISSSISPTVYACYDFPSSYPLLVRHLPSTVTYGRELALWRYLNDAPLRRDPWNPSPPVLSIIERELPISTAECLSQTEADSGEDAAYIVMDRLYRLQDNPLKSVGDWIDFIRQLLQGLVFLHEHNIAGVSYPLVDETWPPAFMMDIGLAPPQTHFSRVDFPVKYYLLDFSRAVRLRVSALARPSCSDQISGLRGRSKNTVLLSASRPRVPAMLPDPFIGSLSLDTHSMNLTFTLADARARSDSDVTFVSSGFDTPDANAPHIDTPKQCHFFSQPSSIERFSDPEAESGSEEATSDEEMHSVRVVSPATRALLFAADLKRLALMLEDAVQLASPVRDVLVPIFTAMRQAKILSLSAEDALRSFENIVRPLDVATVVT
ncbi:hypothetical protein JB92DRAFT_3148564 [Gautieria morchelliformis]|nr:hypothetical protein JB92DRAFT_3148564 [Gautieria morchelliformis]